MEPYTKIPNRLLDGPNGMTHAEERVLMRIHRLITGYHILAGRNISYAVITKMSGVKKVSPIMQSLRKKGIIDYQSNNGKISEIKILKPMTSGNHTNDLRSSHQLPQVNGSRPAKETIKETNKETDFFTFKKKYPKKKLDEVTSLKAWDSTKAEDKVEVLGSIEWAVRYFNTIDPQFIPKASNYLLERKFTMEKIRTPYRAEIHRKKEAKERVDYVAKAEANADDTVPNLLADYKRYKK